MNILITGASGFVGKNLTVALQNIKEGKDRTHPALSVGDMYLYDVDTPPERLDEFCEHADFVFHLAGVNRPKEQREFMEGNFGFSSVLLETLKRHQNTCPVMLSSSIQATLMGRYMGSEYGKSKKAGEDLFFAYAADVGAKILVYRLPNLFGKWCRPNYNSAVATFCHNAANGLPIQVNDPTVELNLLYIDDLIEELLRALEGNEHRAKDGFCYVDAVHTASLGLIADTIAGFPAMEERLGVPQLDDPLVRKLYSTYLSYLPAERLVQDLKMNVDPRGSFTEIIRTPDRGQFSVNVSKPGITKGNHWHQSKNEQFLVVKGNGLIQMRKLGQDENGEPFPILDFHVSGDKMQVVRMIPGYTHNIINLSDTEDLVTFMWANECFDSEHPDTFFEQV